MNERDKKIFNRLHEHLTAAMKFISVDHFVGIFLKGSQNYNLDTENSDVDSVVLVTPPLSEIASVDTPTSTTILLPNEEQIAVKDIRFFMKEILKQNSSFTEILFTKYNIIGAYYRYLWAKIVKNAKELGSLNIEKMAKAFLGDAQNNYNKLIKNYDGKTLSKVIHDNYRLSNLLIWGNYKDTLELPKHYNDNILLAKSGYYDEESGVELAAAAIKTMESTIEDYNFPEPKDPPSEIMNIIEDMILLGFRTDNIRW